MSEKIVVRTESAPAPFQGAPYSQAIVANGFVFVAGQVGLQPDHTELVGEGIVEQTEQAFDNLAAILEEAGSGLDRLLKTTIYIVDLGDFAALNDVYASYLEEPYPARATIEIGSLPSGALVEIEAIAHR
jgi:2-iminobutanoate/2-iminopropanoate deaminase